MEVNLIFTILKYYKLKVLFEIFNYENIAIKTLTLLSFFFIIFQYFIKDPIILFTLIDRKRCSIDLRQPTQLTVWAMLGNTSCQVTIKAAESSS